ncbi:PepSY domain-containing protein [Fructilactobacillus florum]|uniref:PepSY domain-containing protein n=1 Tax=Fructilactobacillus florum DSM 22689 = JCM 16035 TaxID=1423745 RepID=A0A0R2CKD1_9LACO|nr:PepSY domain-containing protein [Fructilactobacillus florum]KRM91754.1 hypothetical protein FC87_GL000578 [Fructilactobacillus florum DSM 22689 = JCM 16035]
MRKERIRRRKLIHGLELALLILLLLIIITSVILHLARRPLTQAEKTSQAVAQRYAKIDKSDHFFAVNVGRPTYTIAGRNQQKQPIYAIMSNNWHAIQIVRQASGISATQASQIASHRTAATVTNLGLTLEQNKPVWLVSTRNRQGAHQYVYINFSKGKVTKVIKNL